MNPCKKCRIRPRSASNGLCTRCAAEQPIPSEEKRLREARATIGSRLARANSALFRAQAVLHAEGPTENLEAVVVSALSELDQAERALLEHLTAPTRVRRWFVSHGFRSIKEVDPESYNAAKVQFARTYAESLHEENDAVIYLLYPRDEDGGMLLDETLTFMRRP